MSKKKVIKKVKTDKKTEKKAKMPGEVKKPKVKNHFVVNQKSNENAKWYIVHTYSGHEFKVTHQLIQRVETMGLEDKVFEILIPTQERIRIKHGQKGTITERIFPGYLLLKMDLDDNSWLTVRTTPGITGFIGAGNRPTPIPLHEVKTIKKFMDMEAPKYKAKFSQGETVKIVDGPFTEFLGVVDNIDEDKGKVRILVSIFGRETPVELDFLQIQKV